MKETSFCIITLIILGSIKMESYAQQNFVEGYIITNNKDTVKGYINDYNWVINPGIIEFKKDSGALIVEYKAGEINSFMTVNNECFESAIVEIDKSILRIRDQFYEELFEIDTVFLRVLQKGKINLYLYRLKNNVQQYFVEKGNIKILRLDYRRYLSENEYDVKELKISKKYIGQLTYLMSDCGILKKDIEKLKFIGRDIHNLVLNYNNCINDNTSDEQSKDVNVYVKPFTDPKNEVELIFGLSLVNFEPSGFGFYGMAFEPSIRPFLGVAVNSVMSEYNETWSIRNEFSFNSYPIRNIIDENDFFRLNIKVRYLEYSLLARKYINSKEVKPFLNAGISARVFFEKIESGMFSYIYEDAMSRLGFAYTLGFGLNYRKMNFELRYASQLNGKFYSRSYQNYMYSFLIAYKVFQ